MAENIFLTAEEVAIILRISKRTLYNYRECGKLSGYKIGNRILYRTDEVVQFVKNSRTLPSYIKDNIKEHLIIRM